MTRDQLTVANLVARRPEHLYPDRAERATIGLAIARGAPALAVLRGMLRADDYADPSSRVAFEALLRLDDAGLVKLDDGINLLALWDLIKAAGAGSQFPRGPEQIHGLFLHDEPAFGGEDGVRQAAKLVSRASRLRIAQARADQLSRAIGLADGLAEDFDGRRLIDSAAADLSEIASRALSDQSTMSIAVVCDEHDRVMEQRLNGSAPLMPYGIRALDLKTDGADCDEGELVLVAARPSMGKTAFFGAVVRGQNVRRGEWQKPNVREPHPWNELWRPIDARPLLIASAEMSEVKLLDRQCGDLCSIDTRRIQRPIRHGSARYEPIDRENWRRNEPLLRAAKQFVRQWPVEYVTTPSIVEEIERQARLWRRDHKVLGHDAKGKPIQEAAGLIIDHLGCLRLLAGRPASQNEANYIGEIVQRIKNLAKELKIVVYLLVQLNRSVTSRSGDGFLPQLSDMRDSGKIEEIADTVIMLHRPVYYGVGDDAEDMVWERLLELRARGEVNHSVLANLERAATLMEAHIKKARNGETGMVPLGFYRQYTRVTDIISIQEAA